MAHVLKEFDRGYFSGMNRRMTGRAWKEHLLGAADGSCAQTVVNFVSRLEFQDGKRKMGTQRYHGRSTPIRLISSATLTPSSWRRYMELYRSGGVYVSGSQSLGVELGLWLRDKQHKLGIQMQWACWGASNRREIRGLRPFWWPHYPHRQRIPPVSRQRG